VRKVHHLILDVDYFMMQLNKYIENNPHASEDKQNDYIKKEIEKKYKINLLGSYSVQQYSYPELNPEEQKLFNENPVKGLKALYEGKKAIDEAINRYQSWSLHNGNGDAFRHAYWNVLMVKHIDYDWAYRWATAHEEGALDQPPLEKEMDLYNNLVGRVIGNNNKTKSDADLADIIQTSVRNGEMKRIVNDRLVPINREGGKM